MTFPYENKISNTFSLQNEMNTNVNYDELE